MFKTRKTSNFDQIAMNLEEFWTVLERICTVIFEILLFPVNLIDLILKFRKIS